MSVSLVIMDRTIGQHSVCSSDAGRVYAEYCDDDATPGSIIPSHQYLLTTQNSDFQIQWWKRTKNHHFGRNKTFPKRMRNWGNEVCKSDSSRTTFIWQLFREMLLAKSCLVLANSCKISYNWCSGENHWWPDIGLCQCCDEHHQSARRGRILCNATGGRAAGTRSRLSDSVSPTTRAVQ